MANDHRVLCALCRRVLSPEEIDSGKTLAMGSLKQLQRACLSHFFLDAGQGMRVTDYQRNLDVMAMSVVWAERQTIDAQRYQEMNGGHSLSGRHALVVEDHQECAELLKMILED